MLTIIMYNKFCFFDMLKLIHNFDHWKMKKFLKENINEKIFPILFLIGFLIVNGVLIIVFYILFDVRRNEELKFTIFGTTSNVVVYRAENHAYDIVFSNISQLTHKIIVSTPYGNHGAYLLFTKKDSNPEPFFLIINQTNVFKYSNGIRFLITFSETDIDLDLNYEGQLTGNLIVGSIRHIREYLENGLKIDNFIKNNTKIKYENGKIYITRTLVNNNYYMNIEIERFDKNTIINETSKNFYEIISLPQTKPKILFTITSNLKKLNRIIEYNIFKNDYLINKNNDNTQPLSYLIYKEKAIAGAWRFKTFFGLLIHNK
jgi:hypothetical protein